MELGDLSAADAAYTKLKELAIEFPLPLSLFITKAIEAMKALMAGRFEEAERLGFETFAEGQKGNERNTPLHFAAFMFALRHLQGRLAEMDEAIHNQMEMYPDMTAMRAASAFLHFHLGREEQARIAFEDLAKGDFKNIPRDFLTMTVLNLLTILACRFGDTRRAALLYDLLVPHSGHLLMVGVPVACMGAVTHWLGMLAGTLQRWDDAERHFEAAVETNTRIGARPYLAQTQQEYARMLISRGATGDKEKARALLTESMNTCQELGMPSFLKEAEELMEQL
jgi:tetratricopeptide (TPR) repeat protein